MPAVNSTCIKSTPFIYSHTTHEHRLTYPSQALIEQDFFRAKVKEEDEQHLSNEQNDLLLLQRQNHITIPLNNSQCFTLVANSSHTIHKLNGNLFLSSKRFKIIYLYNNILSFIYMLILIITVDNFVLFFCFVFYFIYEK